MMKDGRVAEGSGGEEGARAAFEAVRLRFLDASPWSWIVVPLVRLGGGVGVVGYCKAGTIRGVACEGSPVDCRELYDVDEEEACRCEDEDACCEEEPVFDNVRYRVYFSAVVDSQSR